MTATILVGLAASLLLSGCLSGGNNDSPAKATSSPATATAQPNIAPATTWSMQEASGVGGFAHLAGTAFVDDTHGWAVGQDNDANNRGAGLLILATSDGGTTWKAQGSGGADSKGGLESVAFADATHGWAVGGANAGLDSGDGIILATSDGGSTWKAQDSSGAGTGALLSSVSFVDAAHGWAVGSRPLNDGTYSTVSVILATSDGGASWVVQNATSARDINQLNAVHFVDAAHGWAVGMREDSAGHAAGGVILATSDGGATWKTQEEGTTGKAGALYSVVFTDTLHGWAVGYGGSGAVKNTGPVILATVDGGATWKAQDASSAGSTGGLYSVSFPDTLHGWATGYSWDASTQSSTLHILTTSDGGADWREQDSRAAAGGKLNSIYFVDAAHGWAVGTSPSGSTYVPLILAATR
jgi:photosystem II stability/assembly factor-like uncharacterized protein